MASYGLLIVIALIMGFITYALYLYTQNILEDRLKERVKAVAVAASLSFDPKDIIQVDNPSDVGTPPFVRVTKKLQEIRATSPDIFYAYILRPTNDPDTFVYVADADSLDPNAEIDINHDGIINEEDTLNTPGDGFDVSEIPALREEARTKAITDHEPLYDETYGTFLSGYAPIIQNNKTVGILCLDIEVSDYLRMITETFRPFLLFVSVLFGLLTLMTYLLLKVWSRQVNLIAELDKQKDELLSIVSHQLAAPVTAIKWYLESLLDDPKQLDDSQKTDLKSMQSITEDLSDLVGMILDVSRIQLGKMKVDVQPLDVGQFFHEILEVIEPKAKEKPVNFIKSLPEKLPVALLDKRLTRMTVENLLTNAVKYTPASGNVWFTVTIDTNNVMSITVKDTGVGIPKADQGKIFGKQFRASNVRNAIDGNGFGLYVAKGAIEGQDGKIWFESEEGKGTTFFVQVPLKFPKESTK